jgi:hypothetical protein
MLDCDEASLPRFVFTDSGPGWRGEGFDYVLHNLKFQRAVPEGLPGLSPDICLHESAIGMLDYRLKKDPNFMFHNNTLPEAVETIGNYNNRVQNCVTWLNAEYKHSLQRLQRQFNRRMEMLVEANGARLPF